MEKTTKALIPPPSSSPGMPCKVSVKNDVEQHADALLGLPRRAQPVVDVGDGEGGLVAHGELADHRSGVGKLGLERILRPAERLTKELVQIGFGFCGSTHQRNQAVEVLQDVPGVGVAVVFVVVIAPAHAAIELGIERLDPFAVESLGHIRPLSARKRFL